ncbi:MAG: DegQ family serine endoprotease [Planctomycetota bacterium]
MKHQRILSIVLGSSLLMALAGASPALEAPGGSHPRLTGAEELSHAFRAVAGKVRPCVVNITTTATLQAPMQGGPQIFRFGPDSGFPDDDFLRRFFGFGNGPQGPQGLRIPQQRLIRKGEGSGVLVRADGYILTNNHVVREAEKVTVRTADGRTFPARIVGTDEHTDLAVLKIEADGFVPATLGDSEKLEVGDWVLAVGNPFGLEQTVTAGIVSAKGRNHMGLADYENFIQTDAAINPGNSGGPLVNMEGEVVGINTAIYSKTGGAMGLGFAIPINMVRTVMKSIIETGHVDRGRLGAYIQDLDADLARSFHFEGTEGVLVGQVVAGSPAEKAGIQDGDIITSIDGKKMHDANQLRNTIAATNPGTEVSIDLFRDGKELSVIVEVGHLNDQDSAASTGGRDTSLGFAVRPATRSEAEKLGIEARSAVLVDSVEPGGLAAEAGIQPGDQIVAVNGTRIHGMKSFHKALQNADLKEGVRMRIRSQGVQRFVFLRAG